MTETKEIITQKEVITQTLWLYLNRKNETLIKLRNIYSEIFRIKTRKQNTEQRKTKRNVRKR